MRIFLCLLCLCVAAAAGGGIFNAVEAPREMETVSVAKEAAERLLSAIRSRQFAKMLDVIGVLGGPIASSVTSILKIVIGAGGGDSDALEFVRDAFNEINAKLESFTNEFNEVKSMIDWSAIQVSYGVYERSVRALKTQLQTLVDAPSASVGHFREMFIMKYESSFQNAAEKIYDGIVNDDMIFSNNLLEASAKYTTNHRRNVQMFSMGLTQLLLQAVEINMAYVDLKYATEETTGHMKRIWNTKMLALKAKLESFDETLKSRAPQQIKTDAESVRSLNKHLTSSDLALKLYFFMENKYEWKDFVVVVYDDISGESKHGMTFCNGYVSLNRDGKNVVIASVDNEKTTFTPTKARNLISSLQPTEKDATHILALMNAAAGDQYKCLDYHLKLVTLRTANTRVASRAYSSVMEEICVSSFWGTTCYWAILFG